MSRYIEDKCLTAPCQGCSIIRLCGGEVEEAGTGVFVALSQPGIDGLAQASPEGIYERAAMAAGAMGDKHLTAVLAGALLLKATGHCEKQ